MTYRELLKQHADFRRLWSGQVVSEIGDWLNNIAVLTLTLEIANAQRQGLAMALYAVSRHVPLFLFGPIAGVVVDRMSRKRVMIVTDIMRAFLALGFLLAARFHSLTMIYAVGASLFAMSAFFNVAKRAAIPNLVYHTDALLSANSLSSSTTAATIALGSALGGVAATLLGRDFVFVLNALTFLFSAEMVRRVRARTEKKREAVAETTSRENNFADPIQQNSDLNSEQGGVITTALGRAYTDFREGLRYVRGERLLWMIFLVAGGWGLGNGVARALYSIFGARLGEGAAHGWVAHPSDFGNSVLYFAMGLGGVLGAPLARRFNASARGSLGSRMGRAVIFDGCCLVLFAWMPNLWSASLMLIGREINYTLWKTAQMTIMMHRTEDRYGGRVFASYETLMTLMMVGSMLASGAAADHYGIRPVVIAGGIVIIISGLVWFLLKRREPLDKIGKSSKRAEELSSGS